MVGFVRLQTRVGGDRVPEACEVAVVGRESVACLVVREALLRGDQSLVAGDRAIYPGEPRQAFLHRRGKRGDQLIEVRDDAGDALLVELDRLGHVVEHPEVVDDQSMRLGLAVRPVRAADGLQQRVVTQRHVQVHRLQDGRVEARQQLRRDNQQLERVVRITETVEQPLFGVPVPAVGGVLVLSAVDGHDDIGHLDGQHPVERLLVQHAAFTVVGDHLRAEAVGSHLLLEVLRDVDADPLDPFRRLQQHRRAGRRLRELLPIQVAQPTGQLLVPGVDGGPVDVQLRQPRLEVQRLRRAVSDRLLEAVAAQVAVFILLGAEGEERVPVGAVDRGPGQSEQERVGERLRIFRPRSPS